MCSRMGEMVEQLLQIYVSTFIICECHKYLHTNVSTSSQCTQLGRKHLYKDVSVVIS